MEFEPREHYMRIATACPEVAIADVNTNIDRIKKLYEQTCESRAGLVVFPELCITGYSIGDIVQNQKLLSDARAGLKELAKTTDNRTAAIVGLPLQVGNSLYNCAAVLASGEIKGIVPKQNMPNYGEFYEQRWYKKWDQPNIEVNINGQNVPFGNDLLFDIGGVITGVEICEDLWVRDAPSRLQAERGALVIANPSASNELVGKAFYRRQLVAQQSARLMVAYAYASSDPSESTMDVVMSGHQMIAENGRIVTERKPLSLDQNRLQTADIDLDHIRHDRLRDTNFANRLGAQVIKCLFKHPGFMPKPNIIRDPFMPANESAEARAERFDSIINIQAMGLARRLKATRNNKLVLGLSGGLDSTLALLVAAESAKILGKKPSEVITTLTMPGMASSDRTQTNAQKLAAALGVPNQVIPISDITTEEFKALGHDGVTQDITYENVQARARTELLFNFGNKNGGIVLGTGDLSEIALGWCTFNGDHMNHYNVNATIPKTLVRHLVRFVSEKPDFVQAKPILEDIIDTPVSPELTNTTEGEITQTTEDIVGPYELHDFFLSHLIRWGDEPDKIRFLANIAFAPDYDKDEIDRWLGEFFRRFTANQFKRSVMPDGPKVGNVALSPRGDWRMPSDMGPALWG